MRLLKHHAAFSWNGLKQRKHFSTELHLLVLLKYIGSKDNACTSITVKEGLGIGKGSVRVYLLRAVEAVLSLFKDIILIIIQQIEKVIIIDSYTHRQKQFTDRSAERELFMDT